MSRVLGGDEGRGSEPSTLWLSTLCPWVTVLLLSLSLPLPAFRFVAGVSGDLQEMGEG